MLCRFLIFCLLVLIPNLGAAESTPWQLDQAHTQVGFVVRHMGITRIRGTFKKFEATIEADADSAKLTALRASVNIASIDTGNTKRDAHLQADDFFNVAEHPVATFELKKIEFKDNTLSADIDITIRGIRKTIPFTGELLGIRNKNFDNSPGKHAGYSLSGTINRQDFGLKFNKIAEGVSVVGDSVKIEIELEITRKL